MLIGVNVVKAIFTNRYTIGFTDEQDTWLTEQVKQRKAEDVSQVIRSLVNEKLSEEMVKK